MKYDMNTVRYSSDVTIFSKPIYINTKMQNISVEEVYAKKQKTTQPITLRTKKLVDEFLVSDIHTDRTCEKETVLDNGRRAIVKGTYCASTFVGKLYKINGPSENPLERYVLFVGLSRQNPIDSKQNDILAEETAAENAIVNPIMTIKLPKAIDGDEFVKFIQPYLDVLPSKFILTSKQIKEKKERDLYNEWYDYIKDAEQRSTRLFYYDKLKPLMDMIEIEEAHSEETYYGEE